MQKPIRMEICKAALDCEPKHLEFFYQVLTPLYVGEKHFTRQNLERHLQSLCSVGIFRNVEHEGEFCYKLTDYGRKKVLKFAV